MSSPAANISSVNDQFILESNRLKAFVSRTDILWLAAAMSVILAVSFVLSIPPNDYWWYIRLGEDIVSTGVVPKVDTYSYTQYGTPVANYSWLAAVTFWGVLEVGGIGATFLLRGVLLVLFYLLVWQTCREAGAGSRLASIVTLFVALVGSNNWGMRPQLFAYPLFGLFLWFLWRWQKGYKVKLWVLLPAFILWVNLHASFFVAFFMVGALIVGKRQGRRTMILLLLGMILAVFLNPRGLFGVQFLLEKLLDPQTQQFGVEWGPPVNSNWQMALFFGWILSFPLLVGLSPRRLNAVEWLWFLGFGWLALTGQRYIFWFLGILAPLSAGLIAGFLEGRFESRTRAGRPVLNGLLAICMILVPLFDLPSVRERWSKDSAPALSSDTPVKATNWLAEHPELPGNLWSHFVFASYLIYALPDRPVWIDSRLQLIYPVDQIVRYMQISTASPGWEAELEKDSVKLVMLDVEEQSRLVAAMEEAPDWCEMYRDETAAIFARAAENGCSLY